MRAKEIRALKLAELPKRLEEAQRELFNLRFRLATGQLTNRHEIREVRKSIARMKTIMRERELAGG